MLRKIIAFFICFSCLSFTLVNNFRDLVIEKLESYTIDYPEKIYVQTDKPYYATGEDIWYTAYLLNGVTHQKSEKSRTVYVELINEDDKILSKKKIYVKDVSAAGDFKIEKNWSPGTYMIRAYTNYMRNKGADYFFKKQILVFNTNKKSDDLISNNIYKKSTKITDSISRPYLSFYPESGDLVNNITSKIGIKVTDKLHRNIVVEGYIKDSNGNQISKFKTEKFGLSIITLKPNTSNAYYASLYINGQEFKYPLPKTLPNGYHLSAINNGENILLKVESNHPLGLKNTYLIGHQRGNLFFEKLQKENHTTYNIKLNTKGLKDGVTIFTLFDSNGNPVCERLVYIQNTNNGINLNIKIANKTPNTRDRIKVSINLKDNDSINLSGNVSMSVTDINAVEQSSLTENIKTYLLLNSDLRGHIDDPGYFFQKENDPKRRYLLDLLMLTHGWRRFTWNDLLYNNKVKNRFEPEKGIIISGNTTTLKGSRQATKTITRITVMGTQIYQEKKQTDAKGIFSYGPFIFNDTVPVLLEARVKSFQKNDEDKTNRFVSINLHNDSITSPLVTKSKVLKTKFQDTVKINKFLNQAGKIAQIDAEFNESARLLDEVIINAKKKNEVEQRNDEFNKRTLYGNAHRRLDMNDLLGDRFLPILELLSRLPGVRTINQTILLRNQAPTILLNGMQVQIDDILFLTGNDIDFIDVLTGAQATFFSNSGNGVVAIYSRTGIYSSSKNIKRKPGIIDFKASGYYTAREFFAPDYLNDFDNIKTLDVRTTLHWEPKIILDKNLSTSEISFYTSDAKSKYAIKIEGVTDSGIPIHHVSTFEVE